MQVHWLGRVVLVGALAAAVGCGPPQRQPAAPVQPTLRVGVFPEAPPMAFDQDGHLVGLSIDLAEQLGRALGKPVRFVQLGWRDLIPALRDGRIDVIMSGMTITQPREFQVAFADPYLKSGQAALVRPGDAARYATPGAIMRTTETVGVIEGTTGEVFVRERCPDAAVAVYSRLQDAVQELGQRRVELVIAGAHLLRWFAAQNEGRVVGLWTYLTNENLAWGFRPEDEGGRAAANAVLARWTQDGTLAAIVHRWLPGWLM